MKKLLIAVAGAAFFLTGCLKDKAPNDFSTVGTIVEIPYSGLEYFSSASLNFTSDTITLNFSVNIASPYTLSEALTVQVNVDDTKRTAYNATGGLQYEILPAEAYSFTSTSATIAAGSRLATFSISFYKPAIDPSKNLMLPITITDAQGKTISGNFGTLYYHAIGNDLAGNYDVEGYRDNFLGGVVYVPGAESSGGYIEGGTGVYASSSDLSLNSPKTVLPNSPTECTVGYANLGSATWEYVITYDPTTKQITAVDGNETILTSITANTFKVYDHSYDAALRQIHLLSEYTNSSGNGRLVEETMTKQ